MERKSLRKSVGDNHIMEIGMSYMWMSAFICIIIHAAAGDMMELMGVKADEPTWNPTAAGELKRMSNHVLIIVSCQPLRCG